MIKQCLFGLFLVVALFSAHIAVGQIDTPMIPPEKDLGDLYKRGSASRLVVVGTVLKSEGVSKRLTASIREKMKTSLDAVYGGSLYTIRVEETLCRKEDFEIHPAVPKQPSPQSNQTVTLFVPRDEPLWHDGHQKESLLDGHRYLLFLVEPDQPKQKEWTNSFQLDPERVYYRAEERSRGVVPLTKPSRDNPTPKQPAVLEKVTKLCEALRPEQLADKLAALEKLMASGDPVLQKEAEAAANALRSYRAPSHN